MSRNKLQRGPIGILHLSNFHWKIDRRIGMSEKPNTTEEKKLKVITKAELAKHGEKDDTKWIVVEVLIPPLNFRVELLM
jgi:hypothetical protein